MTGISTGLNSHDNTFPDCAKGIFVNYFGRPTWVPRTQDPYDGINN